MKDSVKERLSGWLRFFIGVALLPACWAFLRAFWTALMTAAGGTGLSAEALSLLGGVAAFALAWSALGRPVRTYILGHELTHALWGLAFGARVSDLHVGEKSGYVKLSRSNVLTTLAPYFFPFYTFVVIVAALVTYAFLRPLPCLPLWLFLVGFTWAFHVLFTLDTLATRQPDVKIYGRVFSWVVILIGNIVMVLLWLAATTDVTFAALGREIASRLVEAYATVFGLAAAAVSKLEQAGRR